MKSTWQATDIAVLDWYRGNLVKAAGGRRENYLPLSTSYPQLKPYSPRDLVQRLRHSTSVSHFYIADLDRLQQQPDSGASDLAMYLLDQNFPVWIDAGLRHHDGIRKYDSWAMESGGFCRPVLATEVFESPEQLYRNLAELKHPHLWTLSLDLASVLASFRWFRGSIPSTSRAQQLEGCEKGGCPWSQTSVLDVIAQAVSRGVQSFLVLNLSDVGGRGTSTGPLLAQIRFRFPNVALITGGGIHQAIQRQQLIDNGATHLLIGSWFWEQLANGPNPQ